MLVGVQYLRAIAALAVVAFHAAGKLPLSDSQSLAAGLGAAGVDIFFVISGFVMCWTTREGNVAPAQFFTQRLVRIVPLYWTLTTLVILVLLAEPSLANITRLEPDHIAASYFFLAWPHPGLPSKLWPVLVPGWTLNYEMFFYLILGLSLFLAPRFRLLAVAGVIVCLVAAGLLIVPGQRASFYLSPLLLEFLAGYVLAEVYGRVAGVPIGISVAALFLSIFLMWTFGQVIDPSDWFRTIHWGLPGAVIVASVLFLERHGALPLFPALRGIGDASYSIYLVQFLVVPAIALAWDSAGIPSAGAAWQISFIILAAIAVSLVGIASYWLVERPLSSLLRGRWGYVTRVRVEA